MVCVMFTGIVDCRVDERLENDFLSLNLCGSPVFSYAVREVQKCSLISRIVIYTQSAYIKKMANELYGSEAYIIDGADLQITEPAVVVSGRAAFIKAKTLEKALLSFGGGNCIHLPIGHFLNVILTHFHKLRNLEKCKSMRFM